MPEAVATVSVDGQSENPLRAGLHTERIADPCSIVFFGASGDLFKRMLLPAVYSLRLHGVLPNDFAVVGVSRSEYTDDEFRAYCKEQLDQFAPPDQKPQGAIWDDFAKRLSYVCTEFDDHKGYGSLAKQLKKNDEGLGTKGNRLFYLSTPPSVFPTIIEFLKEADLNQQQEGWARIIIEKPFGTDLTSARALQAEGRPKCSTRASLSHRPLPRQRAGARYHGAALCQRDLRAGLESATTSTRSKLPRPRQLGVESAAATTTTPARCAT